MTPEQRAQQAKTAQALIEMMVRAGNAIQSDEPPLKMPEPLGD
ncbi:hypothetical protein [Sinimarinibacterium sp. NLF-5-8]|nr:hypothetical protein [Sinimarinibacterium sp. NLF-5-8]